MERNNFYLVILKFSENEDLAPEFMDNHVEWIKSGFKANIFYMAGKLNPNLGGTILAYNTTLEELDSMVKTDPFVKEKIVISEILEITPSKVHQNISSIFPQ